MENTPILSFSQRQIKKNYRSITGHFPSVKNNRSIGFESKLEKAYFHTLEFDESVQYYQEQPQIEIFFNGRDEIYSADCYVKYFAATKKDILVEVKYCADLAKDALYYEQKFEAINQSCKKMNLDFVVFSDEIFPNVYFENLSFLYRYKLNPQNNTYKEQLIEKLANRTIAALVLANEVASNPSENATVANAIWDLVAHQIFKCDLMNQPLSMKSLIEINV